MRWSSRFLIARRWVAHRRALQPVAERLVIELDRSVVGLDRAAVAVPVVDEVVELAHRSSFGAGSGASAEAHARTDAPAQEDEIDGGRIRRVVSR
jgi:hypothetical protein